MEKLFSFLLTFFFFSCELQDAYQESQRKYASYYLKNHTHDVLISYSDMCPEVGGTIVCEQVYRNSQSAVRKLEPLLFSSKWFPQFTSAGLRCNTFEDSTPLHQRLLLGRFYLSIFIIIEIKATNTRNINYLKIVASYYRLA